MFCAIIRIAQSLRLMMLTILTRMFQKSSKNWMLIPKWSAFPYSQLLMATWVSQAINIVKSPIPIQLSALNSIIEKGFGPIIKEVSNPTTCRPISPSKAPPRTPPYPSIFPFGMLQAAREAPPKIAVVKPIAVGMIEGLMEAAIAKSGAAVIPKPIIPRVQSPILRGLLAVLYTGTPFTIYINGRGFIQLAPIIPPSVAMIPKIERGPIIVARAGIDITAQDVLKAPKRPRPVVLQVRVMNWFSPVDLAMAWLAFYYQRVWVFMPIFSFCFQLKVNLPRWFAQGIEVLKAV